MTTTKRRRSGPAPDSPPGATAAAAQRLLEQPSVGPVLLRALRALAKLTDDLDRGAVKGLADEPADIGVLVRLIEQAAAAGRLDPDDPLADARLRWVRDREHLLSIGGPPLTGREVARRLGILPRAVTPARLAGRLIGLPIRRHAYRYPTWQFDQYGVLPGLPAIREALGDPDPWILAAFLTSPNSRLEDETPLTGLRRGNLDAVIRAARTYGDQGAA